MDSIPVNDHLRKYVLKLNRSAAHNDTTLLKRRRAVTNINKMPAIENRKDKNLAEFSKSMCANAIVAIKGGQIGDVEPYVLLPAKL